MILLGNKIDKNEEIKVGIGSETIKEKLKYKKNQRNKRIWMMKMRLIIE